MASVILKQVEKSYDGTAKVVHGIDLEIQHGEFVVFVGPSGCGKSTLLRMIAGLETITGGEVFIDGKKVNDIPARHRDIAMVFQDYALYPHKTLYENMAFGLRLRKTPEPEIKSRIMEAAQLLKIDHMLQRKPAALSGGQRQRVAIGRAIVRQPKVFLFDEPLSNLDAKLRVEMRAEIKKLHQRLGATIIYVTHDQVEAMTLANRIAVLDSGNLVQYAAPGQVYNAPAALFVASFIGSPAMNIIECGLRNGNVVIGDTELPLPARLASVAGNRDKALFGIRPEDISVTPMPDTHQVTASVVITEPLGAETLVTFLIGGAEFTVRCPATFEEAANTRVPLHLSLGKAHLFDIVSKELFSLP